MDHGIKPRSRHFWKTGPMPDGYGYTDRLLKKGETVYVWMSPDGDSTRGDTSWHPATVRPYPAHLKGGRTEKQVSGEWPVDHWKFGGFAFKLPSGDMTCHQAIRPKSYWDGDANAGKFTVIGLHDPNPLVCIKTDGGNETAEDEHGLLYYPLPTPTEDQLRYGTL
jgi:hypothetical protein